MTQIPAPSGGVAAAAGLRYQYLRTAEAILNLYTEDPAGNWSVSVESATDDSIDYQIRKSTGGRCSFQVKAGLSLRAKLTRSQAIDIIGRMSSSDSLEYVLQTNRVLTPDANALKQALDSRDEATLAIWRLPPGSLIEIDPRNPADTQNEILARIQAIRSGAHLSYHASSLAMITATILDLIFQRAGSMASHEITTDDIGPLLKIKGSELVSALGRAENWLPLNAPSLLLQRRPHAAISQYLSQRLCEDHAPFGTPRVATVAGFPGTGKTSGIAAWLRDQQGAYPGAVWLNAANPTLLAAQARAILVDQKVIAASEDRSDAPLSQQFRDYFSSLAFPWLIVLDAAPDAGSIEEWLPQRGDGHIIITTTDRTWPINLGSPLVTTFFSDSEAVDLIASEFGLAVPLTNGERRSARDLNRVAGGWPLAIAMLCKGLSRTFGTLEDWFRYQRDLEIEPLNNDFNTPYGYSSTAAEVIRKLLPQSSSASNHAAADSIDPSLLLLAVVLLGGTLVPTTTATLLAAHAGGVPPPDPSTHAGRAQIDDAVVQLKERGLVDRVVLPPSIDETVRDRLSVHTVVGSIVRADSAGRVTESSLFATSSELGHRLDDSWSSMDFTTAFSLLPATESLLDEIINLDRIQLHALILMGNLAKFQMLFGNPREARKWLLREIEMIDQPLDPRAITDEGDLRTIAEFAVIAHADLATAISDEDDVSALPAALSGTVAAAEKAWGLGPTERLIELCQWALQNVNEVCVGELRELLGTRLISLLASVPPRPDSCDSLLSDAQDFARFDPDRAVNTALEAVTLARNPIEQIYALVVSAELLVADSHRYAESLDTVRRADEICTANGFSNSTICAAYIDVAIGFIQRAIQAGPKSNTEFLNEAALALATVVWRFRLRGPRDQVVFLVARASLSSLSHNAHALHHERRAQEALEWAVSNSRIPVDQAQAFAALLAEANRRFFISPSELKGSSLRLVLHDSHSNEVTMHLGISVHGPTLIFHAPKPSRLYEDGVLQDGLLHALREIGLESGPAKRDAPLAGWRASVDRGVFRLFGPQGITLVETIPDQGWADAAARAGSIWVVYGGQSLMQLLRIWQGEYFGHNGYVRFSGGQRHNWLELLARILHRPPQ